MDKYIALPMFLSVNVSAGKGMCTVWCNLNPLSRRNSSILAIFSEISKRAIHPVCFFLDLRLRIELYPSWIS